MKYQVTLGKAAKRDLQRLDNIWQKRVVSRLQELVDLPRPSGVAKLRGTDNEWRIRIGDYRVIYEIDDMQQLVNVLRIKHRREAYR